MGKSQAIMECSVMCLRSLNHTQEAQWVTAPWVAESKNPEYTIDISWASCWLDQGSTCNRLALLHQVVERVPCFILHGVKVEISLAIVFSHSTFPFVSSNEIRPRSWMHNTISYIVASRTTRACRLHISKEKRASCQWIVFTTIGLSWLQFSIKKYSYLSVHGQTALHT